MKAILYGGPHDGRQIRLPDPLPLSIVTPETPGPIDFRHIELSVAVPTVTYYRTSIQSRSGSIIYLFQGL